MPSIDATLGGFCPTVSAKKTALMISGSATSRPSAVTSFTTHDAVRMYRKSARSRRSPKSGLTTKTASRKAQNRPMPLFSTST